jgi:hypothetical protein
MAATTLCQRCGKEIDEGTGFCPHCGEAATPGTGSVAQGHGVELSTAPPRVVTAPSFGRPKEEASGTRRVVFAVVAVVAVLLIAGLAYLASRPAARPGEEKLAGAIRPGSPEFPSKDRLMVDFDPNQDATGGQNSLGNYVVTMNPTVRNFTGRTISGLEFHAAGVDLKGQTVRERNFVTEDEIEPNKILKPAIGLSFPDRPADLKLELTGVRFK